MNPESTEPIQTKLSHSGRIEGEGREEPVREFDNTTLDEAVSRGLVNRQAPDTARGLVPTPPEGIYIPSSVEKKEAKKPSVRNRVIAGLAGVAVLAGGGLGLHALLGDNEAPEGTQPVAEAPVVPGPVKTADSGTGSGFESEQRLEAQKSFNEFIKSFEIQRDAASFEDIADQYTDNFQKWVNSGLTVQYDPEIVTNVENNVITFEEKFDPAITDKMYTTSENAQAFIDNIQAKIRRGTIIDWGISMDLNEDKPYVVKYDLIAASVTYSDGKTPSEATSFTVNADIHVTDNGDETVGPNRIAHGSLAQMDIIRHETQSYVLDTTTNTWKVDSVRFYAAENNSK